MDSKQKKTSEEKLTYRLITELTLLSLLLIGTTLTIAKSPGPEMRVPYVVSPCESAKSRLNYNDKNTWCTVRQVGY